MDKYVVKEFASEIIETSKGRINMVDAKALAIVYISKKKNVNPSNCLKWIIQCRGKS